MPKYGCGIPLMVFLKAIAEPIVSCLKSGATKPHSVVASFVNSSSKIVKSVSADEEPTISIVFLPLLISVALIYLSMADLSKSILLFLSKVNGISELSSKAFSAFFDLITQELNKYVILSSLSNDFISFKLLFIPVSQSYDKILASFESFSTLKNELKFLEGMYVPFFILSFVALNTCSSSTPKLVKFINFLYLSFNTGFPSVLNCAIVPKETYPIEFLLAITLLIIASFVATSLTLSFDGEKSGSCKTFSANASAVPEAEFLLNAKIDPLGLAFKTDGKIMAVNNTPTINKKIVIFDEVELSMILIFERIFIFTQFIT